MLENNNKGIASHDKLRGDTFIVNYQLLSQKVGP